MREIKGPEDVKITEAVPWPVKPGLILPYDYIAIEEVGQIIEIVRSDTQVFAEDPTKGNCERMMAWLTLAKKLIGENDNGN